MQEMLGMEKNKKVLVAVIIGSIIIALLGAYMIFFNNPKQVFLGIMDKLNNKGLEFVNQNIGPISLYNNDFVTNLNLDYYIERDAERVETKTVINEETGEESVVTNNIPYTQILSNNLNVYANRSKKNSHDIVRLTLPNEEESTTYNLYYQNGTIILDASQYEQFVKLNNEVLKFGNAKPSTIDKVITMYNRAYEQFKKQFKDSDFYKISITENTTAGNQTVHKYGVSITQERINQIIEKALQSLSRDQEFINAYISYQKDIDINSSIDKTAVRTLINGWIEEVKAKEINDNTIYEAIITTTGMFNENIMRVEMFKLEDNSVLKSLNIGINNNVIQVEVQDNANTVLNINANILENDIQMNITNEKLNINATLNDFLVSKEITLSGFIDNNRIIGKYIMKRNSDDTQLNNELDISLSNGTKDIMYIKMNNKTNFETVTEYVNSKKIYSIDQLDIQVKEFVDKFKIDIVEKLGIEI